MHILEPVVNTALQEQIIGRVVRFKSHEMLPPEQRKVDVFLWQCDIDYAFFSLLPNQPDYIRREHWQKTHSEVNPNNWTNGIALVDRHFFTKDETPDMRVKGLQDAVYADMQGF